MREACMRVAWSTPRYKIRVWCAHLKIANVLAALLRYIQATWVAGVAVQMPSTGEQ
jgi:hypothetical protein